MQTLLAVLIPYAAYLAAEALHVSGVLAVVIAGLWAGGKEVKGLSADGRRHAREVWRMLSYVFNGLVFVLLGLQLRHMLAAVGHYDAGWLAFLALSLWLVLMLLRMGWVWVSAHLRFLLQWGWSGPTAGPDPRRMFLIGWAAVRGSITLATALSVPLLTQAGTPFPERELVVFLAAATIILTLALNGIPLPWLIRKLQPHSEAAGLPEENAARTEIARAGIAAVQPALADHTTHAFAEQLIHRYEGKILLREGDPGVAASKAGRISTARQLRLAGIQAERECLYRLHAQSAINDETLRIIEEPMPPGPARGARRKKHKSQGWRGYGGSAPDEQQGFFGFGCDRPFSAPAPWMAPDKPPDRSQRWACVPGARRPAGMRERSICRRT